MPIEAINAGSFKEFSAPVLNANGYINWQFRSSLANNDFAEANASSAYKLSVQ